MAEECDPVVGDETPGSGHISTTDTVEGPSGETGPVILELERKIRASYVTLFKTVDQLERWGPRAAGDRTGTCIFNVIIG